MFKLTFRRILFIGQRIFIYFLIITCYRKVWQYKLAASLDDWTDQQIEWMLQGILTSEYCNLIGFTNIPCEANENLSI